MPLSLSVINNINSKKCKLFLLFFTLPVFLFSQSLSGLWTGVMTNDSNSIRKDQSFEIALTEYKGKVYGYSRSEFIVNDTLYYIMKRVKGVINGDVCEVVDDEIISCNFINRINKGVKVTSTFIRNKQDSTWRLTGKWATNQTKKYYTVTGKVALEEEKDLNASKIFPHLEELNKADDIAFYKERKTVPVEIKNAEPENKRFATLIKTEQQATIETDIAAKPDASNVEVTTVPVAASKTLRTSTIPVRSGATSIPIKTDVAVEKPILGQEPERMKSTIKTEEQAAIKQVPAATPKTEIKNTNSATVSSTQVLRTSADIKKPDAIPVQTKATAAVENKTPAGDITASVTSLAGRKSEFAQVVNFKSDSLELALYDNGEIDGDTVSIFLNGEVIMPKQGLKASAIRKTIHITPGNEEFTLVLYADNLGKYPPNTGLLVVHDGDDTYNIRFSADLQKNAGVVFRRKK